MHPVLFDVGPLHAWSYGLLLVLGLWAGTLATAVELRREGRPGGWAVEIAAYGLVAGILGGKVAYLLTVPEAQRPSDLRGLVFGGIVWYGAAVGSSLSTLLYGRLRGAPPLALLDAGFVGLSLGHVFGRVGCFLAGCCYGRPSDAPWAVVFDDPRSLAPRGVALHPTQLYMAAHGLLVFALLWWLRRRKRFDGELVVAYALAYAPGRFVIEHFRADAARGTVGALSVSQALSVVAFAAGAALLWRAHARFELRGAVPVPQRSQTRSRRRR